MSMSGICERNEKLYFKPGKPGAASRDEGIFVGESLLQQGDEPLGTYSYRTGLTELVPEAFEFPAFD